MRKVIGFILKVLFILLLVGMFVDGFINELKEPDLEFYIGCTIWIMFFVSMPVACLYGKIYGDAKDTTKFLNEELKKAQEKYQQLYDSLRILRANLHDSYEPRHAVGYAMSICESLERVKRLYASKALDKYISEDERIMIFKSIKKELEHLKTLCSEIETKYHGKSRLALPKLQVNVQTETDVLFLMLKVRRATSKGKFYPYPSKIRRTKTTEVYTNEFGEITHESKPKITYTILDFYFFRNNERKPIRSDAQNQFNSVGEKSFLTSEKNNKIDYYEVILTDEDATETYRQCQMIDTVRKVAEDEVLLKAVKKALKGLKLSYSKE